MGVSAPRVFLTRAVLARHSPSRVSSETTNTTSIKPTRRTEPNGNTRSTPGLVPTVRARPQPPAHLFFKPPVQVSFLAFGGIHHGRGGLRAGVIVLVIIPQEDLCHLRLLAEANPTKFLPLRGLDLRPFLAHHHQVVVVHTRDPEALSDPMQRPPP